MPGLIETTGTCLQLPLLWSRRSVGARAVASINTVGGEATERLNQWSRGATTGKTPRPSNCTLL